jgi:peptide/nickel transport system substrate-binding protein
MIPLDQESLYPYSANDISISILTQAIYDGPIDSRSYAYQPVILKKLPSLADGDAELIPIDVAAGERVVDVDRNPLDLEAGVRVRPSGCQADECVIEYDGTSTLQMDQLVVHFELLPGLLWSDGVPLTSSDSVYSFNLQSHPDTPVGLKPVIERTASYLALDEVTTEWRGLPGYMDSTYFTNFFTPTPEHAWDHLSPAELLTAEVSSQKPIGWGPYFVET